MNASVGEVRLDDFPRWAVEDAMPVDLVFSPVASVDDSCAFEVAETWAVSEVGLESASEDVSRGEDQSSLAMLEALRDLTLRKMSQC